MGKVSQKTLNESQAAAIIGISPGTLARHRLAGRIPTWRQIGRLIKYTPEDVDRAIASFEAGSADPDAIRQEAERRVVQGRFG